MRKKFIRASDKENDKRLRIVFRFLIVTSILVVFGAGLVFANRYETDLYNSFVLNFIGTSFLLAGVLASCTFFLYLCSIIVFLNPQRLKRSSITKAVFGGIFALLIAITILIFGATETKKWNEDRKAYANGEWQVKDLVVTDIYRGSRRSPIVLIQTAEGEMTLYYEDFLLYKGQTYRFTYLDATNTIIQVEIITE